MTSKKSDQLPLSRALVGIFLSTLLISGVSWMGWLYYIQLKEARRQDNQYKVIAIAQSCSSKECLKTVYLAELLGLSIDYPVNLYQIDTRAAENKLLGSTLVKDVSIKKIRPGTLFVEYTMRKPMAFLGDYSNTAIDQEGYLFPFSPFFTPKKLPFIYLGLDEVKKKWGDKFIGNPEMQLAIEVLTIIQEGIKPGHTNINLIDVSQAFSESYGLREIVVLVEEFFDEGKIEQYYLRLNPKEFKNQLANYKILRKHLNQVASTESSKAKENKPGIIDLRIDHLAFLKKAQ